MEIKVVGDGLVREALSKECTILVYGEGEEAITDKKTEGVDEK